MEGEIVWEGLQARTFPHGEIANAAIGKGEHVLAAWNPVIARFEGFGGLVDGAARMPRIHPRTALETVIGDSRSGGALRVG